MEILKAKLDLNLKPLLNDFKTVAEEYSQFLGQFGLSMGSWNPKSIERLSRIPTEILVTKIETLRRQFRYYYEASLEGIRPHQEKQILWRILQDEVWSFNEDLFSQIEDDDIIEIYLADFSQFFANSAFAKNCSYDFSDLHAYQWPELFERPQEATNRIIELGSGIFSGQITKTTPFDSPPHIGREIFSTRKIRLKIEMGIVSPLKNANGKIAAAIATFKAKKIDD